MPNGNVLAPMSMPGGITLQGFQPFNVFGALQKRQQNVLSAEERRQRMSIAQAEEERAKWRFLRDVYKMTNDEEERDRKRLKERNEYALKLMEGVDNLRDYEIAKRSYFTMYPEDQADWQRLEQQYFPNGVTEEGIKQVRGFFQDVEDKILGPEQAWFRLEPGEKKAREVARGIGKPTELKGPELSQAVKDILAEKGLTELTASPVDIKAARVQAQKEKVEVAAGRGVAGIKAQIAAYPDKPIPIPELLNVVDQDTLAPYPVGTTYREAEQAGALVATPTQRAPVFELDNAAFIVERMARMADQIILAETPTDAVKQRIGLEAGALTKKNPVAAAYKDIGEQATGILARTTGGEKGVLTDRDIERVKKAQPGFGDTRAVKDIKMLSFRLLIRVAREAALNKVRGQRVEPRLEAMKEATLKAMETGNQNDLDSALSMLRGDVLGRNVAPAISPTGEAPTPDVLDFDAQGNRIR